MGFALCFTSALEYWNVCAARRGQASASDKPFSVKTPSERMRDTEAFARHAANSPQKPTKEDTNRLLELLEKRPLHIMVGNPAERISRPEISCHVFAQPLPSASLAKIFPGAYACAPEFAFVQMGTKLPFIQLVKLGFEICGTYSETSRGIEKRPSLTTAEKLLETATSTSFPGCENAARAASYVLDGSASPRETQLAMLLSLPAKYGGYGLPRPLLNHRIALSRQSGVIGKHALICDLFWPDANLAIEYDSDEFHTGALAISRDSQRRIALEVEGITCINIVNMRLKSFVAFDETALGIAKILGKRIRRDPRAFAKKNRELREAIGIATDAFEEDMYSM